MLDICKVLEADGILTGAGKPKWRPETVKKILQNEKYIGDARLQKTYTIDFLSKKRVVNNGIVPQYYVKNSHEGIIPKELYLQVQEELVRRTCLYDSKGSKRVYSSKYALSSIVFCGECGEIYRRIHWNNRGKKSVVWRCLSRLEEMGTDCSSGTILETDLQNAVTKAINMVIADREGFIQKLSENIRIALGAEFDKDTVGIDAKLDELQNELLRLASNGSDYDRAANQIHELRSEKQNAVEYNARRQSKSQRIAEMTEFLEGQDCIVLEYSDGLTRQLVEKIRVDEGKIKVEFKSGVVVEV